VRASGTSNGMVELGNMVTQVQPDGSLRRVYRGDGRSHSELFENGLDAKEPSMSVEKHLAGGNGLISTSLANHWWTAASFAIQNHGSVLHICDHGNGMKVKYDKPFRHLRHEQEVVFVRIEPTQIEGAESTRQPRQMSTNPASQSQCANP
jgi:hypothetical protein